MVTEALFKAEQSEAQFQASVQDLATLYGWEYMHIRPGLNQRGMWRTPITGGLGAGWPDLILIRGEQMIFAELKSERGKLTSAQVKVLNVLEGTGHRVFCWKPSQWEDVVETLK